MEALEEEEAGGETRGGVRISGGIPGFRGAEIFLELRDSRAAIGEAGRSDRRRIRGEDFPLSGERD